MFGWTNGHKYSLHIDFMRFEAGDGDDDKLER